MENSTIRELTDEELQQIDGGLAPLIGGAIAAFGHFSARTFISSAVGRVGLGLFVYETAKSFRSE